MKKETIVLERIISPEDNSNGLSVVFILSIFLENCVGLAAGL